MLFASPEPPTKSVDDALRLPTTLSDEAMEEEAEEMRPPVRVESDATNSDDDAFKLPETFKLDATVEEAEEINPPVKVDRLFTSSVVDAFNAPVTWRPLLMEDEAFEMKPPVRVESPVIRSVPEEETFPEESTEKSPPEFAVLVAMNKPLYRIVEVF